jgi:protein-ribulosamine 3-kinase
MFGFPLPTCCGDTQQDNTYKESWADFYANNRLRHILTVAESRNGKEVKLARLVDKTASCVVPRLLSPDHLKSPTGDPILPSLIHGDLWSGNHSRGSIDNGPVEDVVFDPSSAYAHSEFEFGIMRMFGPEIPKEYFKIKGKDQPVEEFEDRVRLYEL